MLQRPPSARAAAFCSTGTLSPTALHELRQDHPPMGRNRRKYWSGPQPGTMGGQVPQSLTLQVGELWDAW